jgi:RNA polymerase sigma factor FliA
MSNDRAAGTQFGPTPDPSGVPSVLGACSGYRPAYCTELDETEVIRQYVPMVKRIATHLKGRLPETVQLDDLIQAGLIAVLRIMRHSGVAQIGDAQLHSSIRNAMTDEARRETWAPVRTVRLAKTAAQAMRDVKQRAGRDGSDEEIAAEMGIALAEYHRVLVEIAGIRLLPLDEFDEGGEERLKVTGNQETSLHQNRVLAALAESIALLPERERLVISLYYEHELNMDEVGQVLGLNKSTVCRAHGRALLMLRTALGDWSAAAGAPQQATGD